MCEQKCKDFRLYSQKCKKYLFGVINMLNHNKNRCLSSFFSNVKCYILAAALSKKNIMAS